MKQEILTQERLKELLSYTQETGVFTWCKERGGHCSKGKTAGWVNKEGYREIKLDGVSYRAHRLVWLYMFGFWPEQQIDHINGKRDDNRLNNLRAASKGENMQNTKKYSTNMSGFQGVSWHQHVKKYVAQISVAGKKIFLGYWDTPEMADKAYRLYKAQVHVFNPTVRSV